MSDTVVLTYIYKEFWGTDEFYKSTNKVGLPVYNCWTLPYVATGCIMRMQYDSLLKLRNEYKYVIYSDGADTYFVDKFTPPDNILIVSAEKNCFPDPSTSERYPQIDSPWKYVNAGNWCAPIDLAIRFFEEYQLNIYQGKDVNGQREWHDAYLKGKDEFPIKLDTECEYFQTTAFAHEGDIIISEFDCGAEIENGITNTRPYVFHGNGRTDMDWLYKLNVCQRREPLK